MVFFGFVGIFRRSFPGHAVHSAGGKSLNVVLTGRTETNK